jgi:hypothetical protein
MKTIDGLEGPKDLTIEAYREYDTGARVYRINAPVALYYKNGGSTHRVVDSDGVVHCITYGPRNPSVVLRWKNKGTDPVGF